jgi:uncharacterized protein YdaU (DUF1376 family)
VNFFKLYIGDYQRDTAHLSMAEHGAYILMLQHYYATEKPLPVGKALHRMLRAQDKKDRDAIDAVSREFWTETKDGLVNLRANEEIGKATAQAETNARIAREREERRKASRSGNEPSTNRAKNDQPNQTPDTRHQKDNGDDSARARLDRLEASCREAAGGALDSTSTGLMVLDRPLAWLEGGCDLELDVIPAIRAAAARASPGTIRAWKYFDRPVADAKASRDQPMLEGRINAGNYQSPDSRSRENHIAGIAAAVAEARR